MSIIAWIVLGLIAGFIGGKIVDRRSEGVTVDIVLGIIGALVGGFIFNEFGAVGITRFNPYGLLVAVTGSVIVLVAYHALFGGSLSRRRF
jgi:uncharacterized membrane protein YeaQ/YmgE (transglycosylase-associated protein family)